MWFDDDLMYEAISGKGTHVQPIESFDPETWDFYDVQLTAIEVVKMQAFLSSELGCGYDWLGLFLAQGLGIHHASKTKWFCSELVVAAMQSVGLLPGAEPCHYSPNGLYDLLASDRMTWAR
jgi:hypothetical protein